mgnify:CR=1 FL=1
MLLTMAGILLPAAEFDTLPAIVATVDGHAVTRDAVVARLKNSGKLSPEGGPAAMRAAARQAAETEVYFFLLGRLLATENITPSEEAAARHLAELERLLPHGLPTRESGEKARIAASENYRWNVALQEFLRRAAPEVIAVSDAEIEQVYRLNQDQFRLPEQYQFGVIRIPKSRADAREAAETVRALADDIRARLRQGEDFDRVAAETNPSGAELSETDLLGLLKQGDPALPAGSVSRLLENQEAYFLIKVKSKTPGRYIPLKDAAPYLRLQLRSEKTAKALETILRGELKKANVQFFIDQ